MPNLTAPSEVAVSRSYIIYFTGSIKITGLVTYNGTTASNHSFSFEFDDLSFGDVISLHLPSTNIRHTASSMLFKSNLYNTPFALIV